MPAGKYIRTPEIKEKNAVSAKGNTHGRGRLGCKDTVLTRYRKAVSKIGASNYQYGRTGVLSPNFGRKHTIETILKKSKSGKLAWEQGRYKSPSGKQSSWEKRITSIVIAIDPTFTRQFPIDSKRFDLGSETHRLLVELDGCYWHRCAVHKHHIDAEKNKENDEIKDRLAKDSGYRLLRIYEHDESVAVQRIFSCCLNGL